MARASVEGNEIVVYSQFADRDRCKAVPGATWNRARRVWTYPLSPHVARGLLAEFPECAVDQSVLDLLEPLTPMDPSGMNLPLWRHQHEAVTDLSVMPGSMLAFDMGVGKTLAALTLCDTWDARRVLVICPKSVISVWPAEFVKHSPRRWQVLPLEDGSVAKRTAAAERHLTTWRSLKQPLAVVVNYDAIIREPLLQFLCDTPWDVFVMDESHHIKAPAGKQSRACQRIASSVPRRLGLTGTPMPHSPLDIYAQYRAIDPAIFGTSFV